MTLFSRRDAFAVCIGQASTDRDTATSRVQASQAEALDRDQQLGVFMEALRRMNAEVTDAETRATSAETHFREMDLKTAQLRVLTEDGTRPVLEHHAHVSGLLDAKMSRFCWVLSSALLASEVQVTKATDALANNVFVGTSGSAADAWSSHAS